MDDSNELKLLNVGAEICEWRKRPGFMSDLFDFSVVRFLDLSTTSYGRATYYNREEDQLAAEKTVHEDLLRLSRGVYCCLLSLRGVTDRAIQVGVRNLLSTSIVEHENTFLTPRKEASFLLGLVRRLSVPRMIKLFESFNGKSGNLGSKSINNSRMRKLVLRSLWGFNNLPNLSVKYKAKLKKIYRHVWGESHYGRLSSIVSKVFKSDELSDKEKSILDDVFSFVSLKGNTKEDVIDHLGFVMGYRKSGGFDNDWYEMYEDAKRDITLGLRLPLEVLEGIRGHYHRGCSSEQLLRLKNEHGGFTTTERKQVQRKAKEADIDVSVDFDRYDSVKLYLYAMKMGMTEEIREAIRVNAFSQIMKTGLFDFNRIAIILDRSESMQGSKEQLNRPLAVAYSIADVLKECCEHKLFFCGGFSHHILYDGYFSKPSGETDLATALSEALQEDVDAIFVISDGYENSPAGRFGDVLGAARDIGVVTPVYQMNPVFAVESGGMRSLARGIDFFYEFGYLNGSCACTAFPR